MAAKNLVAENLLGSTGNQIQLNRRLKRLGLGGGS